LLGPLLSGDRPGALQGVDGCGVLVRFAFLAPVGGSCQEIVYVT